MSSERDSRNGPDQNDDDASTASGYKASRVGGVDDADDSLAQRIAIRDVASLEAVYNRYSRPVYSLARRLLRDDETTVEVVQEVFMRLWTRADEFDSKRGRLLTWLLTITHHRAIDELRRRRARGQHDDIDIVLATAEAPDGDPAHKAALAETREAVRRALQHLPVAQRRPIELAYFGGLSQPEIAAKLQEPLGTIKTRMRLALQKLREFLRADHNPPEEHRRFPDPTRRRIPAS